MCLLCVMWYPQDRKCLQKLGFIFAYWHPHWHREADGKRVCAHSFAGWQCWPGWLCFWVGVLLAWRRPQWWWVFRQRLSRQKNNSSPQADMQHRIPPSVYEWVCVSMLCGDICFHWKIQPQLCECDFLHFKRSHQPSCSHLLCAYERGREE